MIALVLPSMPAKLTAAFFAAAAAGFILAITKEDRKWLRVFIAGFAAHAIMISFSAATSGSRLLEKYHSTEELVLASAAIIAFIASVRVASRKRQRLTSLAMTLYLTTGWWNSVLYASCGNTTFVGCRGLYTREIPPSIVFLLYLVAPILLFVAARVRDKEAPDRMTAFGLGAFTLHAAYMTSFDAFHHVPPDNLTTAVSIVTRIGAMALFILAARSVPKDRIFALGLAILMIPFVWTALLQTFGGQA